MQTTAQALVDRLRHLEATARELRDVSGTPI